MNLDVGPSVEKTVEILENTKNYIREERVTKAKKQSKKLLKKVEKQVGPQPKKTMETTGKKLEIRCD